MTTRGIEAFGEDGLPASSRSDESPSATAARQTTVIPPITGELLATPTREAIARVIELLERKVDSGRRTVGGGTIGYDTAGNVKSGMWGNEPIMVLANPDGPLAAALIRELSLQAPGAGSGAGERRQCTVCTAIVATYPEGMCCHCTERPWPVVAKPPTPIEGGEADWSTRQPIWDEITDLLLPLHFEAWKAGIFTSREDGEWPDEDEQESLVRGVDGVAVGEHWEAWGREIVDKLVDRILAADPLNDIGIREALDDLQQAEAEYRMMHDRHGDGSQAAGRAWDLMRRAGNKARAALALPGGSK